MNIDNLFASQLSLQWLKTIPIYGRKFVRISEFDKQGGLNKVIQDGFFKVLI